MDIFGRVRGNVRALRILRDAGFSGPSLFTYPVRRRAGDNSLSGDGFRLAAPAGYPLASVVTETFAERRYQPQRAVSNNSIVVDVGASIGAFAQWASREWKPQRIIAVEPSHESFECMKRNCTNSRVEAIHAAIAGSPGSRSLMRRGDLALSTLYKSDVYGSRFEAAEQVRAITLEQLFAEQNVDHCELLKLDCEGAEYEILAGAPENLLRSIGQIVGEYHVGLNENGPEQLRAILLPYFDVEITPLLDAEGGYFYAVRSG
jgi:FkbM family methyltransferase